MENIFEKLKIKPETMFKSMATTTTVILHHLIRETEKSFSISYIDLYKYFEANFEQNLYKVLLQRDICVEENIQIAIRPIVTYVMEFLNAVCKEGSDLYFKDIVKKNTKIMIGSFEDVFPIDQQNMIISNAISVGLLSFIAYLLDVIPKESVNLIVKSVIGKMGEYSASSLKPYIINDDDKETQKILKVIIWIFINGNPDMNISLEEVDEDKFVLIQDGVCRQYINSEILGIKEKICWPINLESFIEVTKYYSKDMDLYFDKKQCMGDSSCRLVCCRNATKGK